MLQTEHYKTVNKVLIIILFANIIVAFLKILVGLLANSGSITADGYHSFTDGYSNIIGLIAIKIASKPADKDHPYGHRKYETLASMFIGLSLLVISGKIIYDAVNWFSEPVTPEINIYSILVMVFTLVINIIVSLKEFQIGKRLNSDILVSDSMHTRSDIFVSSGVIISLILIKVGLPIIIDPIVSIIVALVIIIAALEIFKSTIDVLVDREVLDIDKVIEVIKTFSDVKEVHKIRSRGRNDDIYLDLHILIEPSMSVYDSHQLSHDIEQRLREEINESIQLMAHIEPIEEKDNNDK